jgi:hypothetical protein
MTIKGTLKRVSADLPRRSLLSGLAATLIACASVGGGGSAQGPSEASAGEQGVVSAWPVQTREHVDLWLHCFAMLQPDTTLVPYFKRGYAERMNALKRRANVTSQLDLNADKLKARLAENPAIISAQFLALQASSLDNLLSSAGVFLSANGDPQRSNDRATQLVIATFAQYFPTAADREWLRQFIIAVRDESDRFYHSYWVARQRELAPVLARIDSAWESRVRPALQGYLNNTNDSRGTFILSLPLDGEGRTLSGTTRADNIITATFPDSLAEANAAFYVFAHEAILRIAQTAVDDNTTPTQKREGIRDAYLSIAAVRGGLMLLERTVPDFSDGYVAYYLASSGVAVPGESTAARAAFEKKFPLPASITDALKGQLEVVLGGI